MDKLQHIDDLIRRAAQEPANAFVFDNDWDVIEKKLRRRKNRVYALWFFLSLISASFTGGLIYSNQSSNTLESVAKIEKIENIELNTSANTEKLDVDNTNTSIENISENGTTKTSELSIIDKSMVSESPPSYYSTTTVSIPETTTIAEVAETQNKTNNTEIINLVSKRAISLSDNTISNLLEQKDWTLLKPTNIAAVNNSKPSNNHSTPPVTERAHWEIGPAFTPSIGGKIQSENKDNPNLINPLYQSLVANSEKTTFTNSYGINVQYHPASKFFISSGLFLSQRGESVDYDYTITTGADTNGLTGVIQTYLELKPAAYENVQYKGSNSYHFIEIPLNLGYKYSISRKFELRSQIGLSYMALLQRQGKKGNPITLRLNDLNDLNLNSQNIAASIKTGLYYNKERIAFGLEPMFSMNLNSLDQNSSMIKTKPYSYGLNLSTNFKIYKK